MSSEVALALIALVGALVGGAISSLTTWMIARNEQTKFARERIWDLRREGYTKIMAAIMPAARLSEHLHYEYQQDPHGYDASSEMRTASGQFADHFQTAQNAFHSYRLVLSDDFANAFEALLTNIGDIGSNSNLIPPEAAEMTWENLRQDSQKLMDLAVAEIEFRQP